MRVFQGGLHPLESTYSGDVRLSELNMLLLKIQPDVDAAAVLVAGHALENGV